MTFRFYRQLFNCKNFINEGNNNINNLFMIKKNNN